MGRRKGLRWWWCLALFTLLLIPYENEACAPSRCGHITNISHPFRLPDDPPECGDRRYELGCENNVTLLHLFSGTYHVLVINYNNYTIRIVDPGIQKDDCSSLPRYFLYVHNFSQPYYRSQMDGDPYRSAEPADIVHNVFSHIVYLSCSDPVKDDGEYVDTVPCVNWRSRGRFYAILGDILAGDFKAECHVELVATVSGRDWDYSFPHNKNYSYTDIHRLLSYGFEISWWPSACADLPCPSRQCAYTLSGDTNTPKLECIKNLPLYEYLALIAMRYIYAIYGGLYYIRYRRYLDFGRSAPEIVAGTVTGEFVLPYLTVRYALGIMLLFGWLIYKFSRRHLSLDENIEHFLQDNDLMPIRYSYNEIKRMTKGFKDRLGEGGFGTVYKGKLRSGSHVAIKMLGKSKANGQEFINEVATIGRIHHANVVRLIGYCVKGSTRALVYEFMSNGSLDKHIFSKNGSIPLKYDKIYEISLEVARGIAYLHHGCNMQILHFDIKPHNILLDDGFNPKISDFGLAKLYPIDDSIVTLTAARGTIGYMAPELLYKNIGRISYKADVYSFGMLLMEITSRRRNLNPHAERSSQLYFPLWIYDQFDEEKELDVQDLTKEENDLAKKMIIVALWCIQLKPDDRPSMNKVIEMLEGDVESLTMPPKPLLYPNEIITEDHEFNSNQASSSDYMHSSGHSSDGISKYGASSGGK